MRRSTAINDKAAACTSSTAATTLIRARGALADTRDILSSDVDPDYRFPIAQGHNVGDAPDPGFVAVQGRLPGTAAALVDLLGRTFYTSKVITVSKACRTVTVLLALLPLADSFAQSSRPERVEPLEEVEVVGRVPGPPLWKVSKGEHVLWILPLLDVYPKKMEWNSERVEKLIRQSQEYISPPGVASGIATANPFLLPRVLSLYNTMVRQPDKRTLADDLPPDIFRRFGLLKARYFPKNGDIERQTVSAASNSVRQAILDRENLGSMRVVSAKWFKGNKTILRTDTSVGRVHGLTGKELKALTAAMKEVSATRDYAKAQTACFDSTLAYFENELESAKRRAKAWATGRIDGLVVPAPIVGELTNCMDPFSSTAELPGMQKLVRDYPDLAAPDLDEMRRQSKAKWLAAAQTALSRNATTFSMLSINDIVADVGLVAQLEAKGYRVEIFAEQ